MYVRWGVHVQFKPGQSLIWLPNKRDEFVSVIPGQKAAMTEAMRARQESEEPPTELGMMATVCDGAKPYSSRVKVPADATWDQVMSTWRSKAGTDDIDLDRYPGVAAPYVFKNVRQYHE
jgi:uncharacterized protein YhfF